MIQGILLVIALSLDSFLAALAYAAKRIRIPFASAVVIASISACFLAFSFFLSAQIVQLIPIREASLCAGGVFAFLSLYSFFQSSIKRLLRRNRRGICLHYGNIAVVMDIYLDEKKRIVIIRSCFLSVKLFILRLLCHLIHCSAVWHLVSLCCGRFGS